ncbi:tRNA threonylcarbamoyladenosine biosynthesis protein TsaB [Sulfurivirga caldicuralii]|uniref:tRNA threonylcarbamoyladenosine biosynthesis protein TsaB n=1 Tax=Sulfurivirga caldicuralii TaxID=364032 RepID=A0A1N6F847_9GAMM|nr:tRNA (adenosine(37)-N6)-threonylcarbamoyltransferase complex dimerization subunit type 1 TsaB [Sulfurivirga caldicuralii]SIN91386.1 tRNA threonylcarbamoyladenosine biosynthesis protein TsaB [Sulfurivirga caldicuralii]
MNILALETATSACSVVVCTPQGQVHLHEQAPQSHAAKLLPMVDEALQRSGLESDQLDMIAFGRGPGAFTGLRIATATAQGLALGWNLPVIGIDTLEALAWQGRASWGAVPVFTLLDARMGEVYAALYDAQGNGIVSPQLLKPEAALELIASHGCSHGIGDIASIYPQLGASFDAWLDAQPLATGVAAVARARTDRALPVEEQIPVPLYLRNNVADKPKRRA